MKSCRRTAFAALASLAVVSSGTAAQARFATLRGTITDSTRPLSTAVVQLFGTKRSVTTSESGSFAFDSLPPGRYWIGVRRIGYVPASFSLTLVADSVRAVKVWLEPAPYRLSDLEVVGGMTKNRYADLEWRARGAWGRLYTRDDIQAARPFDLIDLVLRNLPGRSRMVLEEGAFFDPSPIRFGRGDPYRRAAYDRLNRNCPPGVSINGSAPWPGTSLRDYQLDDVEAVEVYRHAGMVPAEFSRAAACGLVVLWLR